MPCDDLRAKRGVQLYNGEPSVEFVGAGGMFVLIGPGVHILNIAVFHVEGESLPMGAICVDRDEDSRDGCCVQLEPGKVVLQSGRDWLSVPEWLVRVRMKERPHVLC